MLCDIPILSDDAGNVLQYHSRLITAMIQWGVFVPLAQTVHNGHHLGIWYPELPQYIKNLMLHTIFPGLLVPFLWLRDKGLISHPIYGQIIIKQHENGYIILQKLLVYSGHPLLLEAFPTMPVEPCPLADKKLTDYIIDWT